MTILITNELILKVFPDNKDTSNVVSALNTILPKYDIVTNDRICCFIAQCGHESGGFNKFKENLNYSAKGLCNTWPTRFPTIEYAKQYERNPEKIANKVYSDRLGNGNESSGDGWKYRGRGAIQLTGKENYSKFAKYLEITLDETVTYCETLSGAIESACYFWETRSLNKLADIPDMKKLTIKINGGLLGYEDRVRNFQEAKSFLE